MIPAIIIIGIAFYWLARETDYLRVRLHVGVWIEPYRRTTWRELAPAGFYDGERRKGTAGLVHSSKDASFIRLPNNYIPLCGWGWLENDAHVLPDYKLSMSINNIRYSINFGPSATANLLIEVMKVNTQKIRRTPRKKKPWDSGMLNPHWVADRLAELEYEPECEPLEV